MPKPSSVVWHYFHKADVESKIAMCNFCGRQLSYKSTTSNLKHHLKHKHETVYKNMLDVLNGTVSNSEDPVYALIISKDEESSDVKDLHIETSSDIGNQEYVDANESNKMSMTSEHLVESTSTLQINEPYPKRIKLESRNRIDFHLLKMIVYDFQPFSIVDDSGFRTFVHTLNPKYEIPHRKQLSSNLLEKAYNHRLEQLQLYVKKNAKFISVSLDCWTSINMDNHMAVTAHFISADTTELKSVLIKCGQFQTYSTDIEIYKEIKGILDSWDLYDKVNFIVTNASNLPNTDGAYKYLASDGLTHFVCLAQTLNLVVQNALDTIDHILKKVRKVVNFFRKNLLAKESLTNYQITHQNSLTPKTLVKNFPNRWNSIYLMLERFIELKQSIRVTILKLDANLPEIDVEEWKIIEQICVVLKPFYEATSEMYIESYLVASKAIALTTSLISICHSYIQLKDLYSPVKKFAQKLKDGLENELGDLELNSQIALTTVLDPRFKFKPIKKRENILKIKTAVISKLTDEIKKRPQRTSPTPSTSDTSQVVYECEIPSFSLWNEFDNEPTPHNKSPITRAGEELEKYISEPLIKRTECPYTWWREHKYLYPSLFELFMQHCNIMLNAVPCERIFSKAGCLLNDRRIRLSSSKIDKIMFLNANKLDEDEN